VSSPNDNKATHPVRRRDLCCTLRDSAVGRMPAMAKTLAVAILLAAAVVLALVLLASPGASALPSPAPFSNPPSVRLSSEAQAQIDDLTAQAERVQAEIAELDAELEKYSENYNKLQVQVDELNIRMASLRRELEAAQSDHSYRVEKLEDHLREIYKAGGRKRLLEVVLAADDLGDLINRIRLAAALLDRDQRLADNLAASTARLNDVLAKVDEAKRQQLTLRQAVADERQRIAAALAEREKTLAALDAKIRDIIDQERKREEEEQARLRAALDALLQGREIYTGSLPQTESEIITQFLETAAYYLGVPYVWAGDRPSTGFDCSGYTAYVYAQHGVNLPHYSGYQAEMGSPVEPEDIRPGDLLAFGWPVYHVGIYLGGDLFIHAPRTGDVVKISSLSERHDLSCIRRFELKPRTGPPAVW